ncbi:hypothetical protein MIND_00178700 [Mycena indigotica]|uniref:Uncharacterized protein n=1 Tax=Mycena indigotica TaxID=2126181 RepID=A0A8H6T6I2_9AGAR|nr:uncharacterized protein MIND_00178700 [Mycena indigotica]KAF7311689.1 hypothetical protein MIND_00178700 [Mycena indigotica]
MGTPAPRLPGKRFPDTRFHIPYDSSSFGTNIRSKMLTSCRIPPLVSLRRRFCLRIVAQKVVFPEGMSALPEEPLEPLDPLLPPLDESFPDDELSPEDEEPSPAELSPDELSPDDELSPPELSPGRT